MARHIMAVCVVCLLFADHLPCQAHIGDGLFSVAEPQAVPHATPLDYQRLNAKVYPRSDLSTSNPTVSESARHYVHQRRKRHAGGHGHETHPRPEITDDFLQRIFDEYGQGKGVINIFEFQRMLKQLGLHQMVQQKLTKDSAQGGNNNKTCVADTELVQHVQPHDLGHHHSQSNCSNDGAEPCQDVHSLKAHHKHEDNYTLSAEDMLHLCPVLLYQLAAPTSSPMRAGCIDQAVLEEINNFEATQLKTRQEDIMFVWIYAFSSVFACSILGLVGVAIIPFMDSRYYKHIIQYLVSLAVGTMTGDALLHLLPHSLAGQTERNMIFKGLTCMSGIVFFYITEHGLTMIAEWRKRIAKKEIKQPSRAKVMRDPDSSINNSVAGDKICKSKYSSYPYCYDEIAMDTKNDVWMHLPHNANDTSATGAAGHKRNGRAETMEPCEQSLLSTSHNNYAPIAEMNHHHLHSTHEHRPQTQAAENTALPTDLEGNAVVADGVNGKEKNTGKNDTVTVILREHESSHHGHSHKHGHVHSPPESLSAVAWMIIMGDGLHNFTDGMAIGAAFAENIAGGFSTSLAVFCHELPHELGDFAILLKAGMSVKSAVYYNLLTGVLSFIGMIFGIVFGQSPDTAQWMFAAAAGLFIYIALVDMMPELSSAHKSLEQFALQILGMSSGVIVMLLIAIYEGDLMNVFSSASLGSAAGGHVH